MLAIGLDYGSTNSLVVSFVPNMSGSVPRTYSKSEVRLDNEYIRSPKRLLHNIDRVAQAEIEVVQRCIRKCVREMLIHHLQGAGSVGRTGSSNTCDMAATGDDVVHMAITVPNAFKDRECVVLKKAVEEDAIEIFGRIAMGNGGDRRATPEVVMSLIPEPVAAALYFAYAMNGIGALQQVQYVVVSDVGGGTTDLALVKVVAAYGRLEFEVVHTEHMFSLGGNDIDNAIADYMLDRRPELRSIDREVLVKACCELKVGFSRYGGQEYSEVTVLGADASVVEIDGEEVVLEMSRDELRDVLSQGGGFLSKYRALAEELKAKLGKVSHSSLYLLPVGGTSRLSLVRDVLRDVFAQYRDCEVELNTEKAQVGSNDGACYDSVVRGAAIYAAYKAGCLEQSVVIKNRTMHRISLCYGDNRLHECVMQCSSDGHYDCRCRCESTYLNQSEGWFKIGAIRLYQGGGGSHIDDDCELLCEVMIDDKLYLHGRNLESVGVNVRLDVRGGRLYSIEVRAEGCCADGSDFVRRIECEI